MPLVTVALADNLCEKRILPLSLARPMLRPGRCGTSPAGGDINRIVTICVVLLYPLLAHSAVPGSPALTHTRGRVSLGADPPRIVAVGQHPFAIAIDERSSRAFVLNQRP